MLIRFRQRKCFNWRLLPRDEKYEDISRSWFENWEQLSAFWSYSPENRRLIYTTNPIESFYCCLQKVTGNKPTFPSEDASVKGLFSWDQEFGERAGC
ncbi:MAG: transposase [Holosporaceae bacterium]|nr:transposase [Holosporaceae bacterium]